MPLIADDDVPLEITTPVAPQEEQSKTGMLDTLGAAGTLSNWPYRVYRDWVNRAGGETDIDHDPFAVIKGTKYESDPERFAYSHNEQETQAIMREWDQDDEAKDALSRSGWFGTVAGVGMGMIDPTIFLPVARIFSGAAQGYRALRLAGDVAVSNAAAGAVSEYAMYKTTPGYTFSDAAKAIGSDTLLGGILGGAVGLFSKGEHAALAGKLNADREEWGADLARSDPAPGGAAVSDTRTLELNLPKAAQTLDPTQKFSPSRRMMMSPSTAARRATADLVETPYIYKENAEGIATTQGPALDRLARMKIEGGRVAVAQDLDELWYKYRLGRQPTGLIERATVSARDMMGRQPGKASFSEFKEMIDDALRNGDEHPIPEVAEAAKRFRAKILAPWRDEAISAGLLPEGVDVKTADSYMMRVWNKEKLAARRLEAIRIFADWFEGNQTIKSGIQERVARDSESLADARATVADLEAKIAKRQAQLDELGARSEEMTSLNRQAFQRAGRMREDAPFGLDALRSDAQRNNARGGAVFETKIRDRGNTLADRASGKDAELEDLRRRLDAATERHDSLRADLEKAVLEWEGKSTREAKSAIKARTKAEEGRAPDATGRLAAADPAIDTAIARILGSNQRLSRQELEDLANEVTNRIIGSPDGRLPYETPSTGGDGGSAGSKPRGPLASREFMIPDEMIREFLDRDIANTLDLYLRTMVPDVLLTKKFGDTRMTEALRKIDDDYSKLAAAAKSDAARAKLEKQRQADIETLADLRDRVRGTLGFSSTGFARKLGRTAATVAKLDVLTNLGGVVLSSLPDLAGLQWRYGFATTFRKAWAPMLKSLTDPELKRALAKHRQQLRAIGVGAETYLNLRGPSMGDVADIYRPTTRLERGVNYATSKFQLFNVLSWWTDQTKFMAGTMASQEIGDAALKLAAGKATKKQIRNLAESGIDGAMAQRISAMLQSDGGSDMVKGVRLPNTEKWADAGAREAFEGAVARDVDLMIITPGAEKPIIMSKYPALNLILQYRGFVAAAHERLLVRGMMQRDINVLHGLASGIVLGALAEYASSVAAGRDTPESTADWVKVGINRSGALGWYSDGNSTMEKLTGLDMFRAIGATRKDARYISRSKLAALLGPTAGKVESIMKVAGDAAQGKWTAGDTKAIRRLMIGQNLFYIRRQLDKLEGGFNEAIGVEPLKD